MLLSVILAAALAMAEPAAATAAEPAPAAAKAAKAAKAEAPKKVCVEEPQVGSHFKRRICATPEEWENRRLQDSKAMARTGAKVPTCTGVAC